MKKTNYRKKEKLGGGHGPHDLSNPDKKRMAIKTKKTKIRLKILHHLWYSVKKENIRR